MRAVPDGHLTWAKVENWFVEHRLTIKGQPGIIGRTTKFRGGGINIVVIGGFRPRWICWLLSMCWVGQTSDTKQFTTLYSLASIMDYTTYL